MTPNQCLIFVLMAGIAGFIFGMVIGVLTELVHELSIARSEIALLQLRIEQLEK
jgi:hypothetical protein